MNVTQKSYSENGQELRVSAARGTISRRDRFSSKCLSMPFYDDVEH